MSAYVSNYKDYQSYQQLIVFFVADVENAWIVQMILKYCLITISF